MNKVLEFLEKEEFEHAAEELKSLPEAIRNTLDVYIIKGTPAATNFERAKNNDAFQNALEGNTEVLKPGV